MNSTIRILLSRAMLKSKHKDIVYVMDMAYSVGAEGLAFAIEQEAGEVE